MVGIVEIGGSLEKFNAQPHPSPIVPPMSEIPEAPSGQ